MYRKIAENDRDWDDDLNPFSYIGQSMGCGCCSGWEGLTVDNMQEYILELEEKLTEAKDILALLYRNS